MKVEGWRVVRMENEFKIVSEFAVCIIERGQDVGKSGSGETESVSWKGGVKYGLDLFKVIEDGRVGGRNFGKVASESASGLFILVTGGWLCIYGKRVYGR
jgi:hypothetical protein